jgi:L-seryl-tRNA(Ser) seleniumtransferase
MGFDVVTFSGDKLFGGPQSGIILGKKAFLDKIKKNHLLRALRCDKISLALLSTTLRQYLHPASIVQKNATLQLLTRSKNNLMEISKGILSHIDKKHHDYFQIIEAEGKAGSGAYPVYPIPSLALQIRSDQVNAENLSRQLRLNEIPILGYIENDIFHINLLAILEEDISLIGKILNKLL